MKLLDQGMIDPSTNNFLPDPSRVLPINAETQGSGQSSSSAMWSKRINLSPEVIASNQELIKIFMTPNNSSL
jgi:hypothetical protein